MPQKPTYFEIPYKGPWKGTNTMAPETDIDPAETPSANNFLYRIRELRSRPRQKFALPGVPGDAVFNGIVTFLDSNDVVHTVCVTPTGLYQLNAGWQTNLSKAWNLIGVYASQPGPNVPIAHATFVNKFYWTNGANHLYQWDGITSPTKLKPTPFVDAATISQPVAGTTVGAFFMGELNSQLIMLNTVEGKGNGFSNFPQRVRWSASGNPTIWDPTVDISAGYVDELDVPDSITGFFTIGRNGFIFRSNGITEMVPTGVGTNPYDFNHLWASDRGIGNIYAFSVASYGPVGFFISNDDVYEVSLGGFERVGGNSRDAIFNDLVSTTSNPVAAVLPYITQNFIYLMYVLTIPVGNNTIMWVYSVDDKSWTRWTKQNGLYTGKARFVAVS